MNTPTNHARMGLMIDTINRLQSTIEDNQVARFIQSVIEKKPRATKPKKQANKPTSNRRERA